MGRDPTSSAAPHKLAMAAWMVPVDAIESAAPTARAKSNCPAEKQNAEPACNRLGGGMQTRLRPSGLSRLRSCA